MLFLLSTTIVITWLMYLNRLSCRTASIGLFMSTMRGNADPEELARASPLLVKLPKSARNKVFHRHMRDSDFETLLRELSAGNTIYYNRE